MTAPRANIVFNNSTGSDTAASGLGPATAVTGTAAAHTNGTASFTLILTNSPDLSGVQVGDLMWVKTASGRQFSVINTIDDTLDRITCDDTFNIASGSPVDYAIGGKRATLDNADSRHLASEFKFGWSIEFQYTGTNYTLSSGVTWDKTSSGRQFLHIFATGGRVVIEMTAAASFFGTASTGGGVFGLIVEGFKFIQTNAAHNGTVLLFNDSCDVNAIDCIFGSDTAGERIGTTAARGTGSEWRSIGLYDCQIINTTGNGVGANQNMSITLVACHVRDCAGNGVNFGDGDGGATIINSVIEGNMGAGILGRSQYGITLLNSTIHGNGSHGVRLNDSMGAGDEIRPHVILNNTITANGGYGVSTPLTNNANYSQFIRNNNFGTGGSANTSGARNNFGAGAGDLAVDPGYANAGSSDFTPGANLKAAAWPTPPRAIGANGSQSVSYLDIGAVQREEPAGGVNIFKHIIGRRIAR